MATLPDAAHDYICWLETEITKTSQELAKAKAEYDALKSHYDKTVSWLAQLEIYCAAITATNLCVEKLIALLDSAFVQTDSVSNNANDAAAAFIHIVEDVKKLSCCIEKIKCLLEGLGSQIPGDDPLRKPFDALLACVKEAFTAVKEVLSAIMLVLENTDLLFAGLDDNPVRPGLAGYFLLLKKTLTPPDQQSHHLACLDLNGAEVNPPYCSLLTFPLGNPPDDYYELVTGLCADVRTKLYDPDGLRDKLKEKEAEKIKKQTCFDSLQAAFTAAGAAKACKK